MPATHSAIVAPLAALATIITVLAAPTAGLACSCLRLPVEQHIRLMPAIFEGRVVEVRQSRRPGMGYDDVVATLQVSARWKGNVPGQVQVHGHTAGNMCGYADFPIGEALLVLAHPRSDGDGFTTSFCTMAPAFNARSALDETLRQIAQERELLERQVAEAPQAILPAMRLARHLENWQDLPTAARIYASIGRAVPELQLAHAAEGRVLFAMGRYRDAIPPLARAVALQPPDPEAAWLLGQARFHAGDRARIESMDFRGLEARDIDLSGRDLSGKDFSEARLERARFDGARLVGARFTRAIINASFVGADLSRAALGGAGVGGVDFSGARLDGADLAGARLYRAILRGASLRGISGPDANLYGAVAVGAVLAEARLPMAVMDGADFTDANFVGASLIGALLNRSSLCGADLSGADLRAADLRGARFDARTRFPPGFDPAAAGMVAAVGPDCGPPR